MLRKGYPEYNPSQPRDARGRWGGGSSAASARARTKQEVNYLLLTRYKLRTAEASTRLVAQLGLKGYSIKPYRGGDKIGFGVWLDKQVLGKVARDVAMSAALDVGNQQRRVNAWVGKLESALRSSTFPRLFTALKSSNISLDDLRVLAGQFYGSGTRKVSRAHALKQIWMRWQKLVDFGRASSGIRDRSAA